VSYLRRFFLVCLILSAFTAVMPAEHIYPEIQQLTQDDPLYRQISYDIAAWYRYEKQGSGYLPPLSLYRYTPDRNETIFSVASRMNLPYETIALINGIEHPDEFIEKEYLLIPNRSGLFIPKKPSNELERIMAGWRDVSEAPGVPVYGVEGAKDYFFLPGERFHPVERAYFLSILFRLPLDEGVITSGFGLRASPITSRIHHHNGIDISAPRGSDVYAARDGTVSDLGYDDIFGTFVLLDHTQGYQTLYGHLESLRVELNQSVKSGMIIGTVGSTGLSTGPHLHFEIRRNGEAHDPNPLMPLF